ncbi:MAG: hypothetical protein ABSG53_10550 [Thermoguttaceae bacterium]|jgi:hypothetical protein
MDIDTLAILAAKFKTLCKFTATSKAGGPERTICLPGDEIEVERWHSTEGLTDVVITSQNRLRNQVTSVPWAWVMDAGAPKQLKEFMPPAPKKWNEILQ